jgi:hypothetical protein
MHDSDWRRTINRSCLLLTVLGLSSVFVSTAQADVPNRFQKNRASASGISTGVYSCRQPLKQRPDLSKRFGWRYCSCFTDWMQTRFASEMNAKDPDLANIERKMTGHPEFQAAVEKCINFAQRTEGQSGPMRSPYTPSGESSAAEIARRFDKCYFPRAKRDGSTRAMMYCTCKVDARRAGYSAARIAELCE